MLTLKSREHTVGGWTDGALVSNLFLPLLFLPFFTIFKTSVHVTNYRSVKRNTDFYKTSLWDSLYKLDPMSSLFRGVTVYYYVYITMCTLQFH